eukprot:4339591-Amphidinium_carterae.1
MLQAIESGNFDPDASRSVVLGGLVAAAERHRQGVPVDAHERKFGGVQPLADVEPEQSVPASPETECDEVAPESGSDLEGSGASGLLSDLDDLAAHEELEVPA